ncbi:MAG: class I SAM-dependent methyltransferase [Opitutae bacterium]|nr:class I SAM-dependent methyltransferase [Opitutae bacterium]
MNTDEYLKLAELEDRMWYFHSLHAHVERELARALPAARDARVLDAGCGTGGLILRLRPAHPSWQWSGVDFSALACDLARQRTQGDIREGSITALPYDSGQFDAVTSNDVVCQVDEPAAALAEFYRVLRPGGVAIINVPAYRWLWSYHDDAVQTKHRFTRPELRALLTAAGFRGMQLTHWNALPFPLIVAKRKLFRRKSDTSDVKLFPLPVEWAFRGVMAAEHAWLQLGGRWAWGSSVFAVARRPLAENKI